MLNGASRDAAGGRVAGARPGRGGLNKAARALFWAPLCLLAVLMTVSGRPTAAGGTGTGPVVAIAFDTTGSMSTPISGLKTCIQKIITAVSATASHYVLIDFKDTGDGPNYPNGIKVAADTDSAAAFSAAVNALSASGGGDTPEQSLTAVREASNRVFAFRGGAPPSGTFDQIFMITDAVGKVPPGSPPGTTVVSAAQSIALAAAARNQRIIPVLVGGAVTIPPRAPVGQEPGGISVSVVPAEYTALANGGLILRNPTLTVSSGICKKFELAAKGSVALAFHRRGTFPAPGGIGVSGGATSVDIPFQVDATVSTLLASVSATSLTGAVLIRPDGTTVTVGDPGVEIDVFSTGAFISVENPPAGTWTLRLTGSGTFDATVEFSSSLELTTVGFVEEGPGGGFVPISGQPLTGQPATLQVLLSSPVNTATFSLIDEGGNLLTNVTLTQGDPRALPGAFSGTFTPPSTPFRVLVTGTTTTGSPFQRTFDPLFNTQDVGISIDTSVPPIVAAGTTLQVTYTLTNVGTPATFNLSASTNVGTATVEPTSITLGGENPVTGTATVTLVIPAGTPEGTPVTLVFTATDAGDPTSTNSAVSNIVVASTTPPGPGAPTNLRVTGVTATTVTLIWQDNSFDPQETSWEIERITDSVRVVFDTGSSGSGFQDTGLTPNTTYFYRVRAKNAGGVTDWSNQVTATTLSAAPLPPTNVVLTPISAFAVRIDFTPSAGATSFLIQRRCGSEAVFTTVATLPAGSTFGVAPTGGPGQLCFFQVVAVGPGGASAPSAAVSFQVPIGGKLRVDRKQLSFHVTDHQLQQSLRVTVFNTGFGRVFANIAQPANGEFQITGVLTTTGSRTTVAAGQPVILDLAPGDRRILEVRFSPALDFQNGNPFPTPGRRFDLLIINHTDFTSTPIAGQTVVKLFGSVPKPPRRGGGSGGGGGGGGKS